jgi:hypothetical protein
VAVAILQLQAEGALENDVILVDGSFARRAILSKGSVNL